MIKFLDLKSQYLSMLEEINSAIYETINNSSYIGGENVKKFEKEFAKFVQASHCIGVANGTDAIEIALTSLELPVNSEVIVPANSFISTSEAVTTSGYRVVFCDICPKSCNIDLDDLKEKITSKTKAVIAVHLYGLPAPLEELLKICNEYDLRLIEDCAQAHGATINKRHVGTFGDVGAFSFYPGKNLGAYGDAGGIITSDNGIAERCRRIANHGRLDKYDHLIEGRNSRLDAIQAAILSAKLNHLNDWTIQRRSIASTYRDLLPNNILLQSVPQGYAHAYHLFVVKTSNRDGLRDFLEKNSVQTGIHYPVALPDLPAYSYMNAKGNFKNASENASSILSLPMGEHLSLDEAKKVSELVSEYLVHNT